jgi:hypothetical protein
MNIKFPHLPFVEVNTDFFLLNIILAFSLH